MRKKGRKTRRKGESGEVGRRGLEKLGPSESDRRGACLSTPQECAPAQLLPGERAAYTSK